MLRDRTFLGLWSLNFLFVAAGYSLLTLLPQFARDQSGITERQIGLVFAFNTAAIVVAQLPLSHLIEGRRRMRALALMPLLWAAAWLMVDATGAWLTATAAFVVLRVRASDLRDRRVLPRPGTSGARRRHRAGAPSRPLLRGPLALVGARRNGRPRARRLHPGGAPFALWPLAAAVCLVAAAGALALERSSRPPAPHPARRGGDPRARGAGAG